MSYNHLGKPNFFFEQQMNNISFKNKTLLFAKKIPEESSFGIRMSSHTIVYSILIRVLLMNLSSAYKDLERCNVGDRRIKTNLSPLEYNCPKDNEVFRLKWFVHEHGPYFQASNGVHKVLIGLYWLVNL